MVIHAVDEFSRQFFTTPELGALSSIADRNRVCYKGTEINISTGIVDDSKLKHGISQLQYALPRLLVQNIIFCVNETKLKDHHFFYCPILVTTAELYITKNALKTQDIEKSSSLDQIAKKVPYLIVSLDYGPDFEKHCSKESENLENPSIKISLRNIEKYRNSKMGFPYRSPVKICERLVRSEKYQLQEYFSNFIVCSMKDFPTLLDEIKKVTKAAAEKISDKNEIN